MTETRTLNPETVARWGITTAAHTALADVLRREMPDTTDCAYLAAQLVQAQYHRARNQRIGDHLAAAPYDERIPAQMQVIAAIVSYPAYRRIVDAVQTIGAEWERLAWERDDAQRAEQRRAYPEWLTDHLATHHGS